MVELQTKTETIEKVLEDMKAKYDAADADYQKFSADKNNFQSTLDNLQAAVDQKYLKIHQLCYDLSKICSRFNFVDELHANIENMKQEARIIKNAGIRKNAENEIAKVVKLANDLSSGQGRSKGSNSGTLSFSKQYRK
jgi:chromosome segregation ATPase